MYGDYVNDATSMVLETEAKTFVQELLCKECGREMRWSGMELTSNPAWYPHACPGPDCGWTVCVRHHYPRTITRARKPDGI